VIAREASSSSPFNRILLATEGTEFDVGAERVGIDLAASCGVPLLAVLPLVSNTEFESIAPLLQEEAEAELAAKMERLRQAAQARGVELRGNIRLGEEPYREIVAEARDRQADLVVLRRRGKRSYLANMLIGEMVHTVTGHAPCDVLIVPRSAQLWSHAIVLATDGSVHSDRATTVAAVLAVRYGLLLTVVSAAEDENGDNDVARSHVDRALAVIRAAGAHATGRVVVGKPYEAILAVAEATGADLMVVGRRGVNRVERILVGSTSERVAGYANSAVLIVQAAPPAG
jgi:nucleotide-binding universal stress UspA family protein